MGLKTPAKNFDEPRRLDDHETVGTLAKQVPAMRQRVSAASVSSDGNVAAFVKLDDDALAGFLTNAPKRKKCMRISAAIDKAINSYAHRSGQNFTEFVEATLYRIAFDYLKETGVSPAELER